MTVTASATSAERAALLANVYSETPGGWPSDDEQGEARLALASLQ